MKIFIFGTGDYYRKYYKWTASHEIIALVDNNPLFWGKMLDGHKIIAPKELEAYEYDRIYILSTFINEIRDQLYSLGVSEQKIFYFFQLEQGNLTSEMRVYDPEGYRLGYSASIKKIVMISHDLSITGAQNCLLQAAKLLIRNRYEITVASPYDGDLKNEFLKVGAKVIVDERLRLGTVNEISWIGDYDILFVNTVQLYYLLLKRPFKIPVVWWIHEPEVLYKSVDSYMISKIKKENLMIYAVSEVAKKALEKVWRDVPVGDLIYGIPDSRNLDLKKEKFSRTKLRFITVGSVSKLKGHDILVQAVNLLTEEEKESAEFWLVGKADSKFSMEIDKKIEEFGLPIFIKGEMENQRLLGLLEETNVLICASRVEAMPMAVAEGMMKGVTVIVSDAAGIVRFMNDGENGLIFQAENPESLKEKISYCIKHKDVLMKIAESGRNTYLEKFSIKSFEKRLIALISNI